MGRSSVRRRTGWVAAALSVAFAACGGDSPTNLGGGGGGGGGGGAGGGGPTLTTSVTVGPGLSFSPEDIQVSPGATVTWTWAGSGHNVTFPSASIGDSGDQTTGATFSTAMPTTPGTYAYSCTNHGGMIGSVLVQ